MSYRTIMLMGLFGSLFNNLKGQQTSHSMNTYPQAVISRTKTLEGRYIHSIIQNGGSYFLIDMPVYEDGVVDCWGNVDLEMLKDKILKGWLSPSVPDKERVSKHHLAVWEIESSNWYYNKENYHEFIVSVVKTMNPTLIPHCVRICAKRDKKRASRVRFTSTKTKPKCLPSTSARPTLST